VLTKRALVKSKNNNFREKHYLSAVSGKDKYFPEKKNQKKKKKKNEATKKCNKNKH